jgi:cold shock CspA family protein
MSKTGTIKFFDVKGWGFIVQDNGEPDCYVHWTGLGLDQRLVAGDKVRFDEIWDATTGKSRATNVTGGTGGSHSVKTPGKIRGGAGRFHGPHGRRAKCVLCGEKDHRAGKCPFGGGYGGSGGGGYGGGGGSDGGIATPEPLTP